MMFDFYTSEEFESKYTYEGKDLGATWTQKKTVFRLWAPTAESIRVNLYESGTPETDDRIETLSMRPDAKGTWITEKCGDLNGVYYTYTVKVDGAECEVCDPYARTTGVNGSRAMVIGLSFTDPKGWDKDIDPHFGLPINDAVIYELHLRDLSCHPSAGIKNPGKFSGLSEIGTCTPDGIPTGLDHIKSMGITHLHLLPLFDYGSVDESRPDIPQYNWGYDPVNYNVPEGSYATDPYRGEVRVKEMKQMVKTLHENGISVVMDVVYNHVYKMENFCFNRIVPGYFSRGDSNGSGCGNDTATERSMVRKYIVDSVCYWAEEYHIDGFRFDLVGLMDTDTVNAVMEAVHKRRPNVIFYGEGWNMPTKLVKPAALTTQSNAVLTPGFAFFNDTMRDILRGSVFDDFGTGFVSGIPGLEDTLRHCFFGLPDWSKNPLQTVNYCACHDNMALFDRLTQSNPHASLEELARMNRLCAAICMTSQGIPFIMAGEEMLRSKPLPEGGFDRNSYRSPDSVNAIRWDTLKEPEHRKTAEYYKGLIAFRKAHSALRMGSARDIYTHIIPVKDTESCTAAFHILGSKKDCDLFVIFNGSREKKTFSLPEGEWAVCIDHEKSGTAPLRTVEGAVTLPPISALVAVQGASAVEGTPEVSKKKDYRLPALLLGTAAAAATLSGLFAACRGRKK